MKIVARFIVIITCLFSVTHAQLPKASDYLPLQVGNIWQYEPYGPYDETQVEVIGDTLLGDSLVIYKARYKIIPWDDPNPDIANRYYNFNRDSTVVYAHDYFGPSNFHDFRRDPYDALILIDTRDGLNSQWQSWVGDFYTFFAITDTGRTNSYGQNRQWVDVSEIVPDGDSIIVNGLIFRFVTGIGITKIGNSDTLRYAKVNGVEYGIPLSIQDENNTTNFTTPEQFTLQVYPNPVKEILNIQLLGEVNRKVEIIIYDILGRQVRDININQTTQGDLTAVWDGLDSRGSRPPAGIYFITAKSHNHMQTQKIVYLGNGGMQ